MSSKNNIQGSQYARRSTHPSQQEASRCTSDDSSSNQFDESPSPVCGKFIIPNATQLEFLLSFPVKCFCGEEAHKTYTAEYGPIYECGSLNYNNRNLTKFKSNTICGFHVHERPWSKLLEDLERRNDVNLQASELRACPQYNFTVCSIFKVANTYTLGHPDKVPNCFCGSPVLMRVTNDGSIKFSCKNVLQKGVGRCSWYVPANHVAFPKPEERLHTLLTQEQYLNQRERKQEEVMCGIICDPTAQFLSSIFDNQLSITEQPPYPPEKGKENLGLRTGVTAQEPQGSTDTSEIPSTLYHELQQHHTQNETIVELQKLMDMNKRLLKLLTDIERAKMEKLVVSGLTTNCQERLSILESEIVRLRNRNKTLKEENRIWKAENQALFEQDELPTNCVVCNTESIDYCLKPCFHYGYCEGCAIKATNCLTCGWSVKGIQRIYRR